MGEVTLWLEPAGHVLGSAQVAMEWRGSRAVVQRRLQAHARSHHAGLRARSPAMCSSPRRPSRCRCSAIRRRPTRSAACSASVALFPERTHLVGCYSLGKCQRLAALLREAGWERPIFLHGAHIPLCDGVRGSSASTSAIRWRRRPARPRRRWRARSCSPRRARRRIAGRAGSPIPWCAPPRAGCGCASARGRAASSCRW